MRGQELWFGVRVDVPADAGGSRRFIAKDVEMMDGSSIGVKAMVQHGRVEAKGGRRSGIIVSGIAGTMLLRSTGKAGRDCFTRTAESRIHDENAVYLSPAIWAIGNNGLITAGIF